MAKVQNLFDTAKIELDSIAQLLETSCSDKKRFHKAINLLKKPQNQLKKKLIIKLANGKKKVFQSYRMQYNDAKGPFMGGVRISENLNEDDLKGLAFYESLKHSVCDLPFGGGFAGIDVSISKITSKDLERILKIFSQFLTPNLGSWKDVLTTEKGSNNQTMQWMMEAFEKKKRIHSPATFLSNRIKIDGAVILLQNYLKSVNYSTMFRKLDVAIHGFGERGYLFAKNLNPQNFRVVAISDSTGGVVNSSGFDIEEIKKLKDKFGSLKEVSIMEKREFIANNDLLKLPVDVLSISSKEGVITKEIAENIEAKNVLELANFGISKSAEQVLITKSINILPDLLLNCGFSVLNHFEWVQKMHGYKWSREEISKKLHIAMSKVFDEIKNISDEKKISYKEACLYIGVKRITDSMIERGRA